MNNRPSLAIIILNWNAGNDTVACVHQLQQWQSIQPRIIVVDNASRDDSIERIRANCADVVLLCNTQNLGFAGGSNIGIRAALDAGDEAILLLNNDANVSEHAIATLLGAFDKHADIGIAGPMLYRSGTDVLLSAGGKDPGKHIHTLDLALPNANIKQVDYVSGSVALIRSALLRKVGLLDEAYFFNTEVADLCARAHREGWKTAVHAGARAEHDLHRSSALRSTLYSYYIVRNRLLYTRKHNGGAWPMWMAFWSAYGALLALRLHLSGKVHEATAVWLGTQDGLAGRFGGQNERVMRRCGL